MADLDTLFQVYIADLDTLFQVDKADLDTLFQVEKVDRSFMLIRHLLIQTHCYMYIKIFVFVLLNWS